MDRNLFVCNYRAYFPIDNDDGSNSYLQTNNFLLWGGSKTLMGYNKHFINNSFVYADYSPVEYAETTLGLGRPSEERLRRRRGGGGMLGNGYSSCASSIASYPFIEEGLDGCYQDGLRGGCQEQWYNNTCIVQSPDAVRLICVCVCVCARARARAPFFCIFSYLPPLSLS